MCAQGGGWGGEPSPVCPQCMPAAPDNGDKTTDDLQYTVYSTVG